MRLAKPFLGNFPISQKFGQNLNSFYEEAGLKGHQGIDFAMPNGTPVLSAVNGIVVNVSKDIQKGEGVYILSSDIFIYKTQQSFFNTIYWHLKDGSISVILGQKIVVGQQIGLSNNTGQSTGPHLHFGLVPMTPDTRRKFLESPDNGYGGCVDPMPYLDLNVVPVVQPKTVSFSHSWTVDVQRVKDFQTKHGLNADGIVGVKTQAAIDGLI